MDILEYVLPADKHNNKKFKRSWDTFIMKNKDSIWLNCGKNPNLHKLMNG